ncbi:MAG: hypothetical protein AAGA87_16515 [Pseudomonadota bacterium]
MKTTNRAFVIALAAVATMGGALSASAHQVFTTTEVLPVVDPGDSYTVTANCPPHHFVVGGGYAGGERIYGEGPFGVTADYPASTKSWAVEFTNLSGRPNGAQEASVTVQVTCDRHW